MSPELIRKIDYWIGRPICLGLTIFRRALAFLRLSHPTGDAPRKILVVKLIEQGATVLAYRAIERATQMVGSENVYFLVFERNRAILDILGLIPNRNVFPIRDEGLIVFLRDVVGALWRIRQLKIDAAVDMEFFARASAILTYLSGATRRAGLHRFTAEGPYRGDLFTHRIPYNPHLHVAVAYHAMVEALVLPQSTDPLPKRRTEQRDWSPPLLSIDPAEVQQLRDAVGPLSRRIVLLNPNASDLLPLRRWPTERFIQLGKRLLAEDPGLSIVVTGAPSEQQAAERIAREIDPVRAICAAGRTTLRQLLVLYSMADVLVTNDSGPGHFASLTNIEVAVLFGPETPELFGPLGPRIRVISAELACSPCVSALNHRFSPCHDNVCMQQISVAQVHQEVQDAIYRRSATNGPVLRILPAALTWSPPQLASVRSPDV